MDKVYIVTCDARAPEIVGIYTTYELAKENAHKYAKQIGYTYFSNASDSSEPWLEEFWEGLWRDNVVEMVIRAKQVDIPVRDLGKK